METSMYEDEVPQHNAVSKLKRTMTLDFNSEPSKKQKVANLLGSPDLNLLKLASPELERMIINQNGMVTTTPTPTQFLCPKYVTEEQEAYARGFVDALNELHKQKGQGGPAPVAVNAAAMIKSEPERPEYSLAQTAPTYTTLTTVQSTPAVTAQHFTTTTSLPGSVVATAHSTATQHEIAPAHVLPGPAGNLPALNHLRQTASPHQRVMQLKEEPQTVPSNSPPPMSCPVSPINMDEQELVKLDRKRARNRVAARKCRTRKLERISRLEDRVAELKGQNTELSKTASTLRDQVVKLKQQIMDHVNSGCQVVLSHNLL